MTLPVGVLEAKLGYRFRSPELLIRALTHRSRSSEASDSEDSGNNEQLEFLGDSILGFLVSEALVLKYPSAQEGELSQWKAQLVSANHLHRCALELDVGPHLLVGKGEERNGGRERRTLLADAVEAILAAIYLDGGMNAVKPFVHDHILSVLEDPTSLESIGRLNFKSALQEAAQSLGLPTPRYSTVETSGPEHAKVFTVEARVGDSYVSRGSGSSKKNASQQAAHLLMEQLKFLDNRTGTGHV